MAEPLHSQGAPFASDTLEKMLVSIRGWAPSILARDPGQRSQLEHVVQTLDAWYRETEAAHAVHRVTLPYSASTLIKVVLASRCLRDYEYFPEVLSTMIPLLLPNADPRLKDADYVREQIPHRTVSKSYQLVLDMALMMWRRDWLTQLGQATRWMSCDSSPQCDFNWLWVDWFKTKLCSSTLL